MLLASEKRTATTILVAASDAPGYVKRGARFVCDGVDDHATLQAALNYIAESPSGGVLQLSKGTFTGSSKLTYNGTGLHIEGESMYTTRLSWTGDFFELGAVNTQLTGFFMSDMEIFEGGGSSTTAVGVQSLSALTKGSVIERIRIHGFGGGEFIFNGATAFTFRDNYISHNRASSTGNGLKIVGNSGASWGVTTIRLENNYFASTVSGANPLCYIEDVNTGKFEGNIYENLPAGTVGLRIEATSGNTASDVVFVNEHYEAFTDPPWELHDVSNVVAIGCRGAVPTFSWSAVAAANRHAIVMGRSTTSGTGDITDVRRMLFGLNGPNDINSTSALQVGPVNGAALAEAFMYKGDGSTGQASIWRTYADDTGGTVRLIGAWGHILTSAHASQPSSRFVATAVPTAGGTAQTVLDLGANKNMVGAGSSTFSKMLHGSVVWDPGSLADGATATTTVTVTGATQSLSAVYVGMNQISTGGWQLSGIVTAANTVTVTLTNHTGGTVDLGSGTVTAWVMLT